MPQRPQQRPMPEDARRKAAQAAMRARQASGHRPSPYPPPRRPQPYAQQQHVRPAVRLQQAAVLDEEEQARKRRLIVTSLGIVLAFVLLLVLMIWLFGDRDDSVRLQRQTQRTPAPVVTTASLAPTTALQIQIPSEPVNTPAPLSTDPHDNAPSWQAPSVTDPIYGAVPPAEAQTLPPAQTNPIYAPPAGVQATDPQPALATPQPTPAPAPVPVLPQAEGTALHLPAPPNANFSVDVAPPSFVKSPTGMAYLGANADGSYTLHDLSGQFTEVFSDPIGQNALLRKIDGQLVLYKEGQAIPLPFQAEYVLDDSMTDQGFAILNQGTLSYYNSETGQTTALAEDVVTVTGSRNQDFLYLRSDGTVRLIRKDGSSFDLLHSASLDVTLQSQSQSGALGIFDDATHVYIYNTYDPNGTGQADISSLAKDGFGELHSFYSADERELIYYQEGTPHLFRRKLDGILEQVVLTQPLSAFAKILPAGDAGARYSSLIIHDEGKLWLSTPFMVNPDGSGTFITTPLRDQVSYATTAGNALYFQDHTGALYVMDLFGSGQTSLISEGPVNDLVPYLDGSGVVYLSNGSLWRRSTGQAAELIGSQVQAFWMTADGSRIYYSTVGGGLVRVRGQEQLVLSAEGSGINEESVSVNAFMKEGINAWLTPAPFVFAGPNGLQKEP